MEFTKLLFGANPYEGCYFQNNEYFFVALQGCWFLKSICKKTLSFEVDA